MITARDVYLSVRPSALRLYAAAEMDRWPVRSIAYRWLRPHPRSRPKRTLVAYNFAQMTFSVLYVIARFAAVGRSVGRPVSRVGQFGRQAPICQLNDGDLFVKLTTSANESFTMISSPAINPARPHQPDPYPPDGLTQPVSICFVCND